MPSGLCFSVGRTCPGAHRVQEAETLPLTQAQQALQGTGHLTPADSSIRTVALSTFTLDFSLPN